MKEIEAIAGFERSQFYNKKEIEEILARQKKIVVERGIGNSFFELAGQGEKMLIETDLGGGQRVRVGLIGAYEVETVGVWLHEQINEYVVQGTMGTKFPKEELGICEDLVSEMIGCFRKKQMMVSFETKNGSFWQPYAGVSAYLGDGETKMSEILSGAKTSLGTFWSLRMREGRETSMGVDRSESEVVEMSRLWKRNNDQLEVLGVDRTDLAWLAMAFLGVGIEKAVLDEVYPDKVDLMLYDTSRRIQSYLSSLFRMKEIIAETDLEPTEAVLKTILRYHYGGDEWGGYAGKLLVGTVGLADYALEAKKLLKKRDIFTNTKYQKK